MARGFAPVVALASSVVIGWLLLPAAPSVGQESTEPEGQNLFREHKCNLCHGVPAVEIEAKTKSPKMKGSDLGGETEHDFEQIAAFLRKESDLGDVTHKKEFKGTDEELQAILDWLGTLESPQAASENPESG